MTTTITMTMTNDSEMIVKCHHIYHGHDYGYD